MNRGLGAIAILVAASAAAAVLSAVGAASDASAKSSGRVRPSMLPLRKSSLGAAGRGLRLERPFGVVPNNNPRDPRVRLPLSPNHSYQARGPVFAKLGRISGYVLDYGEGTSGGAGVTEVSTSVDQYKTRADAKSGLSFWKWADRRIALYRGGGFAISKKAETVAPVGSKRFAYLVRYRAANIAPLFGFDEQFTEGRYQADVTVWAGRAATAEKLAQKLAAKLAARITLALAGRLHARPVWPPAPPKVGPPPGGPDLSALALTPTDLGVQASSWRHEYVGESDYHHPVALSSFQDTIVEPSAEFDQGIAWFATANQASFTADVYGSFNGTVDLSSVGDGAKGAVANGQTGGIALLFFSSRRLTELVEFYNSNSPISNSDVLNLAHTVAAKINSAGLGS